MIDLERITTGQDLSSDVVGQTAASSVELRRVVEHIASIAAPEQGWAKILRIFAKVARAGWLEGDLHIELTGDDRGSTLGCWAVLGVGIRERLFAPQFLAVPIDEFQRAVLLATRDALSPLRAEQGLNRLTLSSGAGWSKEGIPALEIEEEAKGDGERITAPPPEDVYTRDTVPPHEE